MWYRVDAQNVLREVSPDWDDYAVEARASGASEYTVLNRPLWGFVADIDTQAFLNALFFHVRQTDAAIALRYRCDGPNIRRWFQMRIEPTRGQGIFVSHELQKSEAGSSVVKIPPLDVTCQCTQCLRYHANQQWIEGTLSDPGPDTLIARRVCPECRARAIAAISEQPSVSALYA